jgi:prevent-host-death family protein
MVLRMVRVTSGELQRKMGYIQDLARMEPVMITNNGRDRLVLMSVEEYTRLKQRDRQVMTLGDFTEDDVAALEQVRAPAGAAAFNHEVSE